MNRLTVAVISLIELLEAEGREFRSQAEASVRRLLFLFFGALCFFAAAISAAFAFFIFAAPVIGRAPAAAVVAAAYAAAGYFLIRRSLHSPGKSDAVAEKIEERENGE